MMIKRTLLLLAGCACLFASCSREDGDVKVITEFPITENLTGERVDLERPEYVANMMGMAGDFYVFNSIRSSYCFQVYDKDFNLVDTLVQRGGGHNEINGSVLFLGQWEGKKESPTIYAYASDTRSLIGIPVNAPLSLQTVVKLETPSDIPLYPKFLYKADGDMYYGMNLGITSSSSVFSYDASTKEIKIAEPPFEINQDLSQMYATQQCMAVDYDRNRICSAYLSYPCFGLYDNNLKIIQRFFIGEEFDTKTVSKDDKYSELMNVQYHNGNILMLYAPKDSKSRSLLVFDGDGTPIASYGVGNAIWYTIDEDQRQLITSNYDSEEDIVYVMRYPLPKSI